MHYVAVLSRAVHLKYDDRLKRLRLVRSANRRLRSDVIETYKILNGNYCINRVVFDIDDMGLRGHDSKLFKRRFRQLILYKQLKKLFKILLIL